MKLACPFCGGTLEGVRFKNVTRPGFKWECEADSHGAVQIYLKLKKGEAVPGPSSGALSVAKSLLERAKRLSGKETPKNA